MIKIALIAAFLIALAYGNVIYGDASPRLVEGNYQPRGRVINLGNLPIYEAPDNVNSRRMIIFVHDIFGGFLETNMMQVTDVMANQLGGFRTVLPNFFRGEGWDRSIPVDPNNSPPELIQLLDRVGDWNSIIRPDLINVIRHYQSQGVQQFGIIGMCWGGRIATLAASELFTEFRASAFVTPLHVNYGLAPAVRLPMFLVPSRDEPDLSQFYQTIRNSFGDNSGHRRFDNSPHGFASTVGNFNDPANQANVSEVIRMLAVFFERNLQSGLSSYDNSH